MDLDSPFPNGRRSAASSLLVEQLPHCLIKPSNPHISPYCQGLLCACHRMPDWEMYRLLTFSFILKILILKAVWPVFLVFSFLEDSVLSQNKTTFYQLDLEKSVTQIYIHTLFSNGAVDPTLPSLFGTAALALQCPNSEDLEPTEICDKQLQVLEEGERESWGGYFISLR